MIYLDTHLAAWLYAGRVDLVPAPVRRLLEKEALLVSPMVALELQYLFEVGRVGAGAETVLGALRGGIGLEVCDLPFERVVAGALGLGWTNDPFDRLIVSQADLRDAPLVTKDRSILDHYPRGVWDDS
ncbi:MAG: type II toxin-antitoxin system VapC family toxin [Planctomycetota bacterium]